MGAQAFARSAAAAVLAFAATIAHAYPAHYFVVREAADGTLGVVSHQNVDLKGTPQSDVSVAQKSARLERGVVATVRPKGKSGTLFVTRSTISPWLRGEFHAPDNSGAIDAHLLPNPDREFVVRVPAYPGATLTLQGEAPANGAAAPTLSLDLDSYDTRSKASTLPAGVRSGSNGITGSPSNRLDILVVAEGYTADQQDKFLADMQHTMDQFFALSPYADFRHLFNVTWLFVPSNQAGADKPSCPETPGAPVITVDTAFDATFCTSGIRRLVTVNTSKVLSAAAAVPDWDKIMVLVNDTEYGGSGGSISVGTLCDQSAAIVQHEFGHSFTLLADEYESAFPGYPACSDLSGSSPCEPNVTDQTDRNSLKWRGWVAAGTPIPTSGPLADPLAAGLWQGARFLSSGMYRQCYSGRMRDLASPFCDVDSEAFVKRLYAGGWGSPAAGVSLIEPGATPSASAIDAASGSSVSFQAQVAGSLQGLTATWRVDGTIASTVSTAHGAQVVFTYVVPDTATHTITLEVVDSTTFTLARPMRSQQWTVRGTGPSSTVPGAPTLQGIAAGNSQATLSFTPPASDGGSPITGYTATCNPGPFGASGSTSPLTVATLSNGTTYSCSVQARNANGLGPASASLTVTPSAGTGAPTLQGAESRKTQGPATYYIPLDTSAPIGGAVSVEPRTIGSGFVIAFRFDRTITAAGTASAVDAFSAPIGTASAAASGSDVLVTLNDIPENRRARVSLTGVNGDSTVFAVSVGFLAGDVDGSRSVDALDIGAVRASAGLIADASTFRYDIDANGAITAADILTAKGRSSFSL